MEYKINGKNLSRVGSKPDSLPVPRLPVQHFLYSFTLFPIAEDLIEIWKENQVPVSASI
jgi:hypothetical protein